MNIEEICHQLREDLKEIVEKQGADSLLLSGGLDSSVLAALSGDIMAFTAALEGSFAPDIEYAQRVADAFGLEHHTLIYSVDDALDAIPEMIGILKTFDLVLPNYLTAFLGLKLAKEHSASRVMTGDGGDELFAGYSYMHKLDTEQLDRYIYKRAQMLHFPTTELGKVLRVEIVQPYLDESFIKFAVEISPDLKVRKEKGKTWGKWILRKAFTGQLPEEIIWREKTALEYGSGSTELRQLLSSKISDEEFEESDKIPVKFINKEHLYYYKVYQTVVGEIPSPKSGEKICSCCGTGILPEHYLCRVCGVPVPPLSEWLSEIGG